MWFSGIQYINIVVQPPLSISRISSQTIHQTPIPKPPACGELCSVSEFAYPRYFM